MAINTNERPLPHLLLRGPQSVDFQALPGRSKVPPLPARNRAQHGQHLLASLSNVEAAIAQTAAIRAPEARGHLISADGEHLPENSLADKRAEAVVVGTTLTGSLVHLRKDDLRPLRRKVEAYSDPSRDRRDTGRPANERLVASLDDVRLPTLADLSRGWLTEASVRSEQVYPVELWSNGGTLGDDEERERVAAELAWLIARHQVAFAQVARFTAVERDIWFVPAPGALLIELPQAAPDVYRVAQPSRVVLDLAVGEISGEIARAQGAPTPDANASTVVLLDSGLAETHPLLQQAVSAPGRSAIPGEAGGFDDHGHGTRVAGCAVFEDLGRELLFGGPRARCRVMAIRLLAEGIGGAFPFLPSRTEEACLEAEEALPGSRRIYNLAVGAPNPEAEPVTSWSAAVDLLAYDAGGPGRLLCVSAGNVDPATRASDYPTGNLVAGLLDPANAMNAVTVGAFTDRTALEAGDLELGLLPLADAGALSPHSRGSLTLAGAVKPDVVMEGGNAAVDTADARVPRASLAITTTNRNHMQGQPLARAFGTSPAVSSASGLLAEIWSAQARLRPATIRALLVHSARWTPAMEAQFPDVEERLRAVGYGVPSRDRVAYSTLERPTLIREDVIDVRVRKDEDERNVRSLHGYVLPLPAAELEAMGDAVVEFSVTLSYFAEPNESAPSRYLGAALRWDLQRPLETAADFSQRINLLQRGDEYETAVAAGDLPWEVGPRRRNRGTIISDRCRVSAAELAGNRRIGIFPVHGWWKDAKARQEQANLAYSLVVTIDAGEQDVDLYTPIEASVLVEAPIEIEIDT